MLNIAVMDSDVFIKQGIIAHTRSLHISLKCSSSLADLTFLLDQSTIDVVLMELFTQQDDIYDCIEFARTFSQRWPDKKLIIYTQITHKPLMMFVIRTVLYKDIVFKHDSIQRLTSSLFTGSNDNGLNSSVQIKKWKYTHQDYAALSYYEWRVLRLLGKGIAPRVVSKEYNLSVKTVSQHKTRIMSKLQCRNNFGFMCKLIEINRLTAI
ncbi:LuxR C-terminal-related transcriptional regulator [Enterobacter asburiae]